MKNSDMKHPLELKSEKAFKSVNVEALMKKAAPEKRNLDKMLLLESCENKHLPMSLPQEPQDMSKALKDFQDHCFNENFDNFKDYSKERNSVKANAPHESTVSVITTKENYNSLASSLPKLREKRE